MIFLQILRLLAVMVLAFGAGKLASKLKMPVILGWLIAGMVLGPHALNLLDQQTLDAAWFGSVEHLLECVAGLIIGTELLWKKLRSAGRQILVTTVTESLGTFAVVSLVFACVFRITGVPVYLAFLFGGIVLATAPAPSLSIVNELKTNGPVTRTLMPMAALVNALLPVPVLNFMLLGMSFSAAFANCIPEGLLENIMRVMNPVIGVGLIVVILNLGAPLDYHLIFGAGIYTAVYILARAVGKYSGAYLGAAVTGAPKTVRNFLGFALLPHSGVSLVFTGIAVSVLSGPAPECASILQGPLRQPRSSMRSLRCS